MKLGLEAEFDAAHRLPSHPGKCSRVHGHTYRVEVVLEGEVGPDGMVMDFFDVKGILNDSLKDMDHYYLNDVLANPTAENMAAIIANRIRERIDGSNVSLVHVKLWEGRGKWVMIDV